MQTIIKDKWIILGLCALSILLRFPYFSLLSVDWDEWTFILMGQDLLRGNLPYTHYWDVKPPGLFYAFSALMWVAGKNLELLRLLGSIIVAISGYFVYLATRQQTERFPAFVAGTILVSLGTLYGVNMTSEHIAILPLSIALYLSQRKQKTLVTYIMIGCFLSLAIYVRTNLALVPLCYVVFFNTVQLVRRRITAMLVMDLGLLLGFILITVLIALPYHDQLHLLLDVMIYAPLSYSQQRLSMLDVAVFQVTSLYLFFQVSVVAAFVLLIKHLYDRRIWTESNMALWGFLIGAELSILIGGRAFAHYTIQILPMLAMSNGLLLGYTLNVRWKRCISGILFGSYLILCTWLSLSASTHFKSKDQVAAITQYLKVRISDKDTIYPTDHKALYWTLDKQPLTISVLHPSNISKPFMLRFMQGALKEPQAELHRLLRKQPTWIIKTDDVWYLADREESIINATLDKDYRYQKTFGDTAIYRLIEEPRANKPHSHSPRTLPTLISK